RIAADTSLKLPIRFGETLKAWQKTGRNFAELKLIPLVFAGWLRYLLGIDDEGKPFEVSPDPNYKSLSAGLLGIALGQKGTFHGKLLPILSNPAFFGINLYEAKPVPENSRASFGSLGGLVEDLFAQMIAGPGAVRQVLVKMLRK
ncbi:MAG: mannitol dehydrogenase family protein, partial [Spirochaetes bacterium]|nr:mannitol dehydrogenase family protein [Spirochaetota bacterium]